MRPGVDVEPLVVVQDALAQGFVDHGALRARPDEVHVAFEDVEELGQLVEPGFAQVLAHRRDDLVPV